MRSKLITLLLLSLVVLSMADHSSESPDDDQKGEEDPLKDGPKDGESKGNDKKEKEKGEKKDKNKEEQGFDDEEQSQWSAQSIDDYFLGKPTKAPTGSPPADEHKTTIEPPQGVFGPNYWNNLGNAGSSSTAAPGASKGDDDSKGEGSEETDGSGGSQGAHGTSGNPFFPYPRPVDIWDRLIVLAAFPICFFAVMLKAELFR